MFFKLANLWTERWTSPLWCNRSSFHWFAPNIGHGNSWAWKIPRQPFGADWSSYWQLPHMVHDRARKNCHHRLHLESRLTGKICVCVCVCAWYLQIPGDRCSNAFRTQAPNLSEHLQWTAQLPSGNANIQLWKLKGSRIGVCHESSLSRTHLSSHQRSHWSTLVGLSSLYKFSRSRCTSDCTWFFDGSDTHWPSPRLLLYRHNSCNSYIPNCRFGLRAVVWKMPWDLAISASLSFGPCKALAKKKSKYQEKCHFSAVWLLFLIARLTICFSFLLGHAALTLCWPYLKLMLQNVSHVGLLLRTVTSSWAHVGPM